ncbi:hypothetical protein BMETH_74_3 [methanotrophic bacterial endosymbiont of Bathymodiolus sp.]|nr:hypothetical protein BMETH_74_3 [methanotrophic bacterial endosymbiont of Bathymodiolus sp.]
MKQLTCRADYSPLYNITVSHILQLIAPIFRQPHTDYELISNNIVVEPKPYIMVKN